MPVIVGVVVVVVVVVLVVVAVMLMCSSRSRRRRQRRSDVNSGGTSRSFSRVAIIILAVVRDVAPAALLVVRLPAVLVVV